MSLFLEAARGQDTSRAPVWLMRQAGRYLPEYRALKEKYTFLQMCQEPELAVEVTLQPLRRYALDAAILFSDIMTPLLSMGADVTFTPGPVVGRPVRAMAGVEALRVAEADEIAPYVAETLRELRRQLTVPVIGFGGAPLTLATYLVEGAGSKEYPIFRQFLRAQPEAAHALLEKLTEVTIRYLQMQLGAGAQAIQLFDSWAGLHDAEMYATFGAPYARRVLEALGDSAPRLYIAVGSAHLMEEMAALPMEALSVDWRSRLSRVRAQMPAGRALQGNLDPAALLAPPAEVARQATRVLEEGLGGAHIFNLGHGMMPQANPDNVQRLLEVVAAFDRHAPR
jgi:uroporphyrinogen decarboxylase